MNGVAHDAVAHDTMASIMQVSITLVSFHQECLQGNFTRLQHLHADMQSQQNRAQSKQEVVRAYLHFGQSVETSAQLLACYLAHTVTIAIITRANLCMHSVDTSRQQGLVSLKCRTTVGLEQSGLQHIAAALQCCTPAVC